MTRRARSTPGDDGPDSAHLLRPAGLLRRLAALAYDALVLFGVLFVATAVLLPATRGHAIDPESEWYLAYLLGVSFAFFGWFWTHGGQTLGLKAWRLKVVMADGSPVTPGAALGRWLAGLFSWVFFGLGFFWMLLDRDRRTLYDRVSRTLVVRLPKKPRPPRQAS